VTLPNIIVTGNNTEDVTSSFKLLLNCIALQILSDSICIQNPNLTGMTKLYLLDFEKFVVSKEYSKDIPSGSLFSVFQDMPIIEFSTLV